MDCKRRWFLQYYLHLAPIDRGSEATAATTYGTRIHEALEGWYVPGEQVNPRGAIRNIYQRDRAWAIQSGSDMKKFDEQEKTSIMLVDYYMDLVEKEEFDAGWKYISAEQEYEMEIIDGVSFIGKVDAIVERELDGAHYLIDHKTLANADQAIAIAHINPQFLGYMLLHRAHNDEYLAGSVMNVIRKVKTLTRSKKPIIQREITVHSIDETNRYFDRLCIIAREMKDLRDCLDAGENPETQAYPHVSTECPWKCSYMQVCENMNDGSYWKEQLEGEFVEYDPYARYDKIELLSPLSK